VKHSLWDQTARTRELCLTSSAAGEVPSFLEIQRLYEETWIKDPSEVISTCHYLTSPRARIQQSKYNFENLLVNLALELRKLIVLLVSSVLQIVRVFNL
jgi:hypothetical protein